MADGVGRCCICVWDVAEVFFEEEEELTVIDGTDDIKDDADRITLASEDEALLDGAAVGLAGPVDKDDDEG